MNLLGGLRKVALWIFLPSLAIKQDVLEARRRNGALPVRLLFADSLSRFMLVAAFVWFAWTSAWVGAIAIASTLGLLALTRVTLTHWLLQRMGGT